jgi:hypothetical protein
MPYGDRTSRSTPLGASRFIAIVNHIVPEGYRGDPHGTRR